MKKYILLLFMGLTGTLNAQLIRLEVGNVKQEQTEWCTVAVSKCVLDYYNKKIDNQSISQCKIMEYARTLNTTYGPLNCCFDVNWGCNNGVALGIDNEQASAKRILMHFGTLATEGSWESLWATYIEEELRANRPIVAQWNYIDPPLGSPDAHVVVIFGIENRDRTSYVHYMDPVDGIHRYLPWLEFQYKENVWWWRGTLKLVDCSQRQWPCHCFNGETDGDEQGVDCGGSCPYTCPPPPPPPSTDCNNCYWDHGEEGYDCGGPCSPCADVTEEKIITQTDQLYQNIMAYNKITAKDATIVKSGKKVKFITEEAGSVVLLPGFHAEQGSEFNTQRWEDLSGQSRSCTMLCQDKTYMPYRIYRGHTLSVRNLLYANVITYEIVDVKKREVVYSNTLRIDSNGEFELWDCQTGAITTQGDVKYRISYFIHYCNGDFIGYKDKFLVIDPPWNKNMNTPPNEAPDEVESMDTHQSSSSAPLNIQEELSSPTLTILPNPNAGSFQLETNIPLSDIATLKVTNMLGATIYEMHNLSSYTIQLPAVAAGQHLVVVVLKDGRVMTEKMIIQQ